MKKRMVKARLCASRLMNGVCLLQCPPHWIRPPLWNVSTDSPALNTLNNSWLSQDSIRAFTVFKAAAFATGKMAVRGYAKTYAGLKSKHLHASFAELIMASKPSANGPTSVARLDWTPNNPNLD